ncbi:MAG: hypothetical protein IJW50_09860, partial [Clostridia bacterium]|nr:hypothetical protein [Clostridia bacterium]
IEKARKYLENFEEIQPYPVSFVVFDGERDFFLYATGFFGLVKCDCPFVGDGVIGPILKNQTRTESAHSIM